MENSKVYSSLCPFILQVGQEGVLTEVRQLGQRGLATCENAGHVTRFGNHHKVSSTESLVNGTVAQLVFRTLPTFADAALPSIRQ